MESETNKNSKSAEEKPSKVDKIVTPLVLQKIVQAYNPMLNLVAWKAEPGTKVGDNYMSIMYAIELDLGGDHGVNENLQVMLKSIPRDAHLQDMINELKAVKVETTMYQDVFPIFDQLQKERYNRKEDLFCGIPKCYTTHWDGKTDYLALENLKVSGYKMGDRAFGLDFNHSACLLRTLARFHAISFAKWGGSREKILKDFPLLNNNIFDKNKKVTEKQQHFFSQSLRCSANSFKEKGEELASFRMMKLAEARICQVLWDMAAKDVDHAVIIHGDCWINNMMFKYNINDKNSTCPVDVKLVDFQICAATSRLIDVFYFVMTSCQLEVLNERESDLLMIYYAEFTSFAERLGVNTRANGLTWENFLKEADEYRLYGVIIGLVFAPMIAGAPEKITDTKSFSQEDLVAHKLKNILFNQLPKCINAEQFL